MQNYRRVVSFSGTSEKKMILIPWFLYSLDLLNRILGFAGRHKTRPSSLTPPPLPERGWPQAGGEGELPYNSISPHKTRPYDFGGHDFTFS